MMITITLYLKSRAIFACTAKELQLIEIKNSTVETSYQRTSSQIQSIHWFLRKEEHLEAM